VNRSSRPSDETGAVGADEIRRASAELGLALTDTQAGKLAAYSRLLAKWNAVYNLTAIERAGDVLTHHLLDSLAIVPPLLKGNAGRAARVLDVGSGGGLPGIPLAIALPEAHVTLLDAVRKKCAFMQQAKIALGLPNLDVVHARVESWRAPAFDVIAARAFADLSTLVRMTQHLVAPEGIWAAMKGALPSEEIAALPPTVDVLDAVKLRVPLLAAERHLVLLRPRRLP
jgi:16S rRNA (guanine527-N7)-methyltransferase